MKRLLDGTSKPRQRFGHPDDVDSDGFSLEQEEDVLGMTEYDHLAKDLERFRYGPSLRRDQIRLLKLKKGPTGSRIEFELHTNTTGESEYYALSYAWITPICDQEVTCNGKRMYIPSNLKLALLRFREKYPNCYLWADAICINQDDAADKTNEVRRLSTIFHDAKSVIVWLGEESETTGLGLKLLSTLCEVFPSADGPDIRSLYLDHSILPDPYKLEKSEELDRLGIPANTASEPWQAAGRILDAVWFGRRWILQEVACSKHFQFLIGSHEAAAEVVLGGAYRILDFPEFSHALTGHQREHCVRVQTIVQLLRAKQEPWLHESLTEILLESAFFDSSDPRDRIFAILGCLKGLTEPEFWNAPRKQLVDDHWKEIEEPDVDPQDVLNRLDHLVDYNKTLPEVLMDVALCEQDHDEFLLSMFRNLCHVDVLAEDIPSWVPTWQFSSQRWRPLWMETADPLNDGSFDVSQAELTVANNTNILQTRAIIFDKISVVSPVTLEKDVQFAFDSLETQKRNFVADVHDTCNWLVQCESIAINSASSSRNAADQLIRFLRCYAFGQEYNEDKDPCLMYYDYLRHGAISEAMQCEDKDTAQITARYRDRCNQLGVPPEKPGLQADDEFIASAYAQAVLPEATEWFQTEPEQRSGRRFFSSELGKIGWIPEGTRPGDELCVVFGFAQPFVIRRVDHERRDEPLQYKILGACYVQDYMDGEVFLYDELERVTIEIV